ncbi:hypothetical protein A3B01_02290 [Candidatus Nomurabacteria bacterium RIFCSPLOWO2_01_FULL_41_52b]|nr:MAG: hypothetical protein A3B01_02290 [Candidatus Nomurabacteria bacterium RIFCSPLOWO2_01_FULL_41_52b]
MQRAFTTKYNGRTNVLKTSVGICLPHTPEQALATKIDIKQYLAIWDTGATGSVITKKVADDLNLKPISVKEVYHAAGKSISNVYLVNILLPDSVMIPNVQVTEANLTNDKTPENEQTQVLIGMDIIGIGDFAVTNFNGKTMLSFRVPSASEIDLVPEAKEHNVLTTGNRQQRRALLAMQRKGQKLF